jgi:hypothetical protein
MRTPQFHLLCSINKDSVTGFPGFWCEAGSPHNEKLVYGVLDFCRKYVQKLRKPVRMDARLQNQLNAAQEQHKGLCSILKEPPLPSKPPF